jgi:hypothetical protein
MNAQRAWEGRFSLYVLLGWLAATALFVALHLPSTLRLGAAEAAATSAPSPGDPAATAPSAAVCSAGRLLGAPHPFEGWSTGDPEAALLESARALPKAEPWEATPTRDLRRFAAATAARDAGKPLSADDAGLFARRPDLWLAFDANRRPDGVDPREVDLWKRHLERRRAAVHGGSVFLAFLGLGAALLGLAAWGARRGSRQRKENLP